MIDIEQRRLCTFEHDPFLFATRFTEKMRRFANERPQPFNEWRDLGQDVIGPERLLAEKYDDAVRFFEVSLDAMSEHLGR